MQLVCVPPDTVHRVWPKICDRIYEAMQRGNLSAYRDVADAVLHRKALLWLAWDGKKIHAAVVTQITVTEWRKVCTLIACGGDDMRRWLHLLAGIEDYARAEGCAAVRIAGRKGWTRVLKDYRAARIILEKDVGCRMSDDRGQRTDDRGQRTESEL